jgi:hypothetical protein
VRGEGADAGGGRLMSYPYQSIDYSKMRWDVRLQKFVPKTLPSDDSGIGKSKERRNKSQRQREMRNKFKNAFGKTPYQAWDSQTRSWRWFGGTWDKARKRWREARKNWEASAPLYFAYGSNLNIKQMEKRAPEATLFASMRMQDWKLVFRGVADIEAAPGDYVEGGLWRITGADELALDRYEGVNSGMYIKDYFTVGYTNKAGEQVEERCLVYLMNRDRGQNAPWKSYFDSIVEGYEDFGLDPTKLHEARAAAEAIEAVAKAEREAKYRAAYRANPKPKTGRGFYDDHQDYYPKSYYNHQGNYYDGPSYDQDEDEAPGKREPNKVEFDEWVRAFYGLDGAD